MNDLLKKLNYKQGQVGLFYAPEDLAPLWSSWEAEVPLKKDSGTSLSLALVFITSQAEALARVPEVQKTLGPGGILWVAYPKQTSKKYRVDVNRDSLWALLQGLHLQPVRQVALDEDWSALRFKPLE